MKFVIHSTESLVFRDGRPFGDAGHVNGGMLRWPWPQTIMGTIRTRCGLSADERFFDSAAVLADDKVRWLEKIKALRIMPVCCNTPFRNDRWKYLFPAPADVLVIKKTADKYRVTGFEYKKNLEDGGVNIPWENWTIPVPVTPEKPASERPELWHLDIFMKWLEKGELGGEYSLDDMGIPLPVPETRLHTAIDPDTGTVREGQLFATHGIRLESNPGNGREGRQIGIAVELENPLDDGCDPSGPCHFGAERRVAVITSLNSDFPACPDWFHDRKYLRLVLITPGDFGAWAPKWLIPDKKSKETPWCSVPGTDMEVRLCSSFIPRWIPISGWDYAKRGPKAMRRLVPQGAVYVIEVKDPGRSQELASLLWGRSINDGLSHADGCGAVCIGNIDI